MALVLAGFLSTQIRFAFQQDYSQLVVGHLAWEMGEKSSDYILVLLAFVYGMATYWGLDRIGQTLQKRWGAEREVAYRRLATLTLIPIGLWVTIQFWGASDLTLVWVAAIAIVCLGILGAISARPAFHFRTSQLYFNALASSLLGILLAPIGGIAVLLALSRLFPSWQIGPNASQICIYALVGVSLAAAIGLWIGHRRHPHRLYPSLQRFLLLSQGALPLLFTVLLPVPWSDGESSYFGYPFNRNLVLLVALLCVWAYGDWLRQLLKRRGPKSASGSPETPPLAVSFPALLAVLLFFKTASATPPDLSLDDYHFGEIILPWWLWSDFGYLPFRDYFPSRGLVNYATGWLTSVFFDGSAAAHLAVYNKSLLALPYLGVGFFFLAGAVGLLPAFMALMLMPIPASSVSEIHVVLTAALCFLVALFVRNRWTQWLIAWAMVCPALVLFAPGQAGLFIIATAPLGMVAFYRAARQEPRQLRRSLLGAVVAVVLVAGLTPVDQMIAGAVRYVVEQSSVNTLAFGIPWVASRNSNPVWSYPLWEILRTAWIAVGGFAALLLYRIGGDRSWPNRQRYLAFAVPIVLLSLLWIPRAAGRIDPGHASRLGIASFWFVCLLLPIVALTAFSHRRRETILLVVVVLGGLLPGTSNLQGYFPLKHRLEFPTYKIVMATDSLTQGAAVGLPNLGQARLTPEHLQRLQTIKAVLNRVLEPEETYLDLTNRKAQYFYLGYPPPIENSSTYNLAPLAQQKRALADLIASSPPVVLASADEEWFDGGSAALRSHLLYRYVVENYLPVKVEDYIFMVQPDRLERLTAAPIFSASSPDQPLSVAVATDSLPQVPASEVAITWLNQAFLVPELRLIPSSWGQSLETLAGELTLVQALDGQTEAVSTPAPTGPGLSLDLSPLNLSGDEAGLLAFDFQCRSHAGPTQLKLQWNIGETSPLSSTLRQLQITAHNGPQLVPLDAAPSWLLAPSLESLEIAVAEPNSCSDFMISKGRFFQRSSVVQAGEGEA